MLLFTHCYTSLQFFYTPVYIIDCLVKHAIMTHSRTTIHSRTIIFIHFNFFKERYLQLYNMQQKTFFISDICSIKDLSGQVHYVALCCKITFCIKANWLFYTNRIKVFAMVLKVHLLCSTVNFVPEPKKIL